VRGGRIKYLIFNKYIVDIVENLGAVMDDGAISLGGNSWGSAPGNRIFSFKIINYSLKKVNIQKNIFTL
jgi:hypothetical protein